MTLVRPPGLHRDRVAGALIWRNSAGRPVTDPDELRRLDALAVPPGWEQVWASADPRAAVQVTGVDARGRTQYRYLPAVVRARAEDKFGQLASFGAVLPSLHEAVTADLASAAPPARRTVLAAMVRVLELGFFRVGNARYAREDHTYGLTTLRRGQVTVTGAAVHFDYVAGTPHLLHQRPSAPRVPTTSARCRRRSKRGARAVLSR